MKVEPVYIFGKHAVYEALTLRPELIREIFIEQGFSGDAVLRLLPKATKASIKVLNQKKLPGGLRKDAVHQGVIASIAITELLHDYKAFMATHDQTPDSCFLMLAEVQDPHNVGAVIRSAAAFGVSGVLIPPHNQAPITGTVVKVSAGMAFRIPLITIANVNATLRDLQKRGFWVYGLAGEGATPLPAENFEKPTVLVLGNEGSGLRQKTREVCDTLVSIPMHPRCESLNAAASAAVVMATWSTWHPQALLPRLKQW